ncbi:MFS transporter [Streptomyces sp. ET3-23]|uniref:MFS transporter n=1 Tax=Streptomyces sp. ET3-23 TaxID=2885643 RepID=UPI001D117C24|nr:MFS transporter [Streptomyces sp. ET3-23]MCC2280555.1 MFS transporter [Streptomyces sp. ET3-23]
MNGAPAGRSLWRHGDFMCYWSACAVDIAGSGVSAVALPLIAVVALHATVWQVSLLNFAERLPPLLVALPAGAPDRHRKRPLMIGAVLVCAVAFTTVPLADAFGHLSLELLYAVALVTSAASLLGSTPRISYLPSLLPGEQLLEANAKIGIVSSLADTAGAQLGGAIVTVLGTARAVWCDVASYLACALFLGSIRTPEPAPDPSARKDSMRAEIADGVKYVWGHPTIRPLLLTGTVYTGVFALVTTLWDVYLLRELGYTARSLGMLLSVAALGGVAGALAVERLVDRYGPARVMLTALAITPFTELPLLLVGPGRPGQATIAVGLFVQLACATAQGSTQRSIRQAVCEPGMQGRMLATGQWITYGTRPLAALLAGAAGTWLGL